MWPFIRVYSLTDTSDIITSVAVHPSQPNIIVTGSTQGWVSLWDTKNTGSGKPLYRLTPPLPQSSMSSPNVLKVAFDPSNHGHIIASHEDGQIVRWTIRGNALSEAHNLYRSKQDELTAELIPSQTMMAVNSFDTLRDADDSRVCYFAYGGDGGLWCDRYLDN